MLWRTCRWRSTGGREGKGQDVEKSMQLCQLACLGAKGKGECCGGGLVAAVNGLHPVLCISFTRSGPTPPSFLTTALTRATDKRLHRSLHHSYSPKSPFH